MRVRINQESRIRPGVRKTLEDRDMMEQEVAQVRF